MKLAVFGATGPTGVEVVQQALALGHDVTALVRNPDKMKDLVPEKDFKIEKIDFSSPESIEPHLQDKDAVLSCLGSKSAPWSTVTLYTDSMKVIVSAMRKNSIRRLVFVSSWYLTDDPKDPPPFLLRWVFKPLLTGRIFQNLAETEQYLQGCDDIDFTAVKAPHLLTGPVTDMEFRTEEGEQVHDREGMRPGICRADVARFMLSTISSEEWVKKCVAVIAVPKK
ncbi:BLVRB [Branchiostoma lanceolatum]|uniref:BLVRB protein n=1 Tax=Branchiostoma lanceolatum TaxID=7740 RepID=A0A8K0EMM9_BRALA|nr:BLVRB [Branchiostoma lanceolatum]